MRSLLFPLNHSFLEVWPPLFKELDPPLGPVSTNILFSFWIHTFEYLIFRGIHGAQVKVTITWVLYQHAGLQYTSSLMFLEKLFRLSLANRRKLYCIPRTETKSSNLRKKIIYYFQDLCWSRYYTLGSWFRYKSFHELKFKFWKE